MSDAVPNQLELVLVSDDVCPICLGELDTGWECNECSYDAYWIQQYIETNS